MAPKFLIAVLVVFFVCFDVTSATANFCHKEICRECANEAENNKGEAIKCEFKNVITTSTLDGNRNAYGSNPAYANKTNSDGTPIANGEPIDNSFVCIKMAARDTSIAGDSLDLIKGCAFAATAQSVCDLLVREEKARNKQDAKCIICKDDYCNGAFGMTSSILIVTISAVFAKILNY